MSYFKTLDEAMQISCAVVYQDCLMCGKPVDDNIVSYDLCIYLTELYDSLQP